MATIEGNEIALRKVAAELQPPVRSGQEAKLDQDTLGNAFVTFTYVTAQQYPSETVAPSWVYAMTYERNTAFKPKYNDSEYSDSILVAWGGQTTLNETRLYPGQTLEFPRGARKIYIRTDLDVTNCPRPEITWQLDRFAKKTWSPSLVNVAIQRGTPLNLPQTPYVGDQIFEIPSGDHLYFVLKAGAGNVGNLTWDLISRGSASLLDTGTVAPGVNRNFCFGPGVGNLPAGTHGHGIVLPGDFLRIEVRCANQADTFDWGYSVR